MGGSSKIMKRSAMVAILFFILASPEAFMLVQSLLGDVVRIASSTGLPTLAGLIVHTLVFAGILVAMMKMKKKKWMKKRYGGGWKKKGGWKKGGWGGNY